MKRSFLILILLAVVSVANADLILTLNGVDAAKEPLEIKGKDNLVIAVASQAQVDANDYSITSSGGTLKTHIGGYLFTFEDELSVGSVSLIANNDMVIDSISVVAGGTIYKFVLFYNPETDIVIAFGINLESLSCVPPEAEREPEPEPESQPEPQFEFEPQPESEPGPEPEPESETEPTDLQSPYDYNNVVPYAQRKEAEKEESLKFCPTGVGLITVAGTLPAKESKGRELPLSGGCGGGAMMGGRGVIDVNSDITSNQIWTPDNTYHIIADVNVQALLVIEPGTIVEFAADKAMFVNNGGALISVGTPNDPVVYTSDSGTPGYADYYCPMYIEETASANTKIMYSYIEYAYVGLVVLNNDLETDIQHNYFYNNVYGIVEYGISHTDIRSNLVVASYYSGIEVFLADANSQASSDSFVLIENNTCDYYQDNGITIHGVNDVNEAGIVVLANNIVSGSYQYGLALVDYYMYATVTNTGYFDNAENKNWEFEEDNPVFETVLPYEMGTGTLPTCYLRQDCNFVNTGSFLIEQTPLIGQTTDVNGIPDYNYVDIGFHYPNWSFVNAGNVSTADSDFNVDLIVNLKDFAILANGWESTYDINDLATMSTEWLQVGYEDPNIEIHISGDSNEGYVDIGISGFTSDTQRVFFLIDGEYISEMFFFEDGEPLNIDTSYLGPGTHQLKVVSLSNAGRVTCSNLKESTFNCFLNYHLCADAYDSNEPHHFCAYYSGSNNISVKVYNEENNLVWSQTYSPDGLNDFIPANVTLADDLDYIVFEETTGTLSSGASVAKPLALKFKPGKVPANIRALIIVPSWWMRNFGDYGVIQAVKGTFETRNVPYRYLKGSQASYEVLAWFGANRNIDYIYYCDHGGYITNGVLRTKIKLSDGIAYSVKQSDFAPGQAPSWCEKLPGNLEKTANSIFQAGFNQGELKFVHFDCCFTGRLKLTGDNRLIEGPGGSQGLLAYYHSDMSWALKMSSSYTQIYQGWWGEVPKGGTSKFNIFAYHEWTKLREGDHLYDALTYAINHTDWIPDGPHDNFRLMGQGDLTDLRIE